MKVIYQELKAADECPYRQPVYDKYGNLPMNQIFPSSVYCLMMNTMTRR